ncbi:MAG: methylated-DNA--[protein]-cysteine S-methyltransferase [Thermoanaerobaculia bacterium]
MKLYARVLDTPVGSMLAMVREDSALVALPFLAAAGDAESVAAELAPGAILIFDDARCEPVARQLAEYFAGRRRHFDLTLAPEGTGFQRDVWRALTGIPYGRTVSYGELARRLSRPDASRAVGRANGANPIPVVVPCHRVVGADGDLTGYGGGLDRKRFLLGLEGALPQPLAFADGDV